MANSDRDFLVGATARLIVSVSDPGTRTPADPDTVVLDVLKVGTIEVTALAGTSFTRRTPGEYVLLVDTTGFAPGVYQWRARATDGDLGVALAEDTFVVRALA